MKNKLKCIVSTVLTLSITTSSIIFPLHTTAAEAVSPNIAMAEAILHGKRQYVKESLLNDDFSTNPHALVNGIGNDKSMMANSLSQYQNKDDENYSAAYKTAVDIMEKVYNGSDYTQSVSDYVVEFAASLLEFFNLDASGLMSDLTQSVGEIRYESILKDALDADYTSSSGNKLSSKESELINLRRLESGAKNLSSFTSLFKSLADNDSGEAGGEDMLDYYNNFLLPYGDTVNDVLSSFSFEQGSWDEESVEALNAFTTAIAMVQQGDRFVTSSDEVGAKIVTYCPTYFLDEATLELIDFADSGMATASKAISSYMFIRSIQEQKDSIAGPLKRIADNTSDTAMQTVYNDFAKEITAAADSQTVKYETVIRYINQSGTVSKFVNNKLSDGLEKAANLVNLGTEDTALSSVFSKASNVVGISGWCADKLIGFEATCKKTYELKYLDKMITQAVNTCKNDITVYESNKTDENAQKVLDDLTLIQKLRLRGETISYSMMSGQFDSPLAKLLSTGTLNKDEMLDEYLDKVYQYHVDALIGASVMPYSTDGFTVDSGDILTLMYDASYGGVYGYYLDNDGASYSIAEPQYRLSNGITVASGGKFVAAANTNYIPFIKNRGGTVLIGSNVQSLSELTQSSGTTTLGSGNFTINDVEITGGTVNSNLSATLSSSDLKMSGTPSTAGISFDTNNADIGATWDMGGSTMTVNSDASISGTLTNGNVYIKGDLSGSGTVDRLTISGAGAQNISGTLNVGNLTYANTGTANQSGTIYVTETVQNAASKVLNGQNTVLKSTGNISGSHYNSSITLDGTTLSSGKTINGSLLTKNTVTTGDITVLGLLKQSGTLTINGNAIVKTDSYFGGTINNSVGTYYAAGDVTVTDTNTFNNLILNGRTPQNISGTLNTVNLTNTNPQNINIENTVNVSGTITSEYGKINGLGTTLLQGGDFGSSTYKGDITVQSDTCNFPISVSGKAVIDANIAINKNTSVNGGLTVNDKNISLNNSTLTVKGDFLNGGTITANTGQIFTDGIMTNNGKINNCDSHFSKELSNSGTFSGGSVTTTNDIFNSGTIDTETINLEPNAILEIMGNSLNTGVLNLKGSGKVMLETKINVSEEYNNTSVSVNDSNIIMSSGKTITNNRTYKTFNTTTDLILDGCTVTADTMTASGNIKLINNAKLIVNKTFTASKSSGSIEIDESSELSLKRIATLSSYTVTNNGTLTFGGDTSLSSTKFTGSGTITVNADLLGSMTISKPKNFIIAGKTPQIIECSGASFDNLNINNTSKSGVVFSGTVYYYGDLSTNNSRITGTVTKK